MTDIVAVALIGAAASMTASFFSFRASRQSKTNSDQLNELKITVDGRLSQLLKITGDSEHAKGVIQGVADNKAENK